MLYKLYTGAYSLVDKHNNHAKCDKNFLLGTNLVLDIANIFRGTANTNLLIYTIILHSNHDNFATNQYF